MPLATTLSPIFFGKTLYGVIVTFRDITKEMEVDKAKSEFVSLASHQLRTPLTAIKWLIQVAMKKGSLNKAQKEFLNDALSSNSRMIALVNDLLNVSRLETGILTVNPVHADVNNLLRQLINEVKPTALKKGITIKFNDYKSKLTAYFDTQLVTQVASVFLTNSIDYSHEKQSIQVFLSKKKNNFEISVKDNGVGISKADQKNLFNKFFRSAEAAKLSTHGSGLGLYIVKRILDVCKGSVRCDSVLGKGSTFTVSFPLKMKAVTGGKGLIRDKIS
jgi:signal transduction histidine kinase